MCVHRDHVTVPAFSEIEFLEKRSSFAYKLITNRMFKFNEYLYLLFLTRRETMYGSVQVTLPITVKERSMDTDTQPFLDGL